MTFTSKHGLNIQKILGVGARIASKGIAVLPRPLLLRQVMVVSCRVSSLLLGRKDWLQGSPLSSQLTGAGISAQAGMGGDLLMAKMCLSGISP